jgi:hypothetical protein
MARSARRREALCVLCCGTATDVIRCIATQGAELMSKFGINVPPGMPAHTLEEVDAAVEAMKDDKGEACHAPSLAGRGMGTKTGQGDRRSHIFRHEYH